MTFNSPVVPPYRGPAPRQQPPDMTHVHASSHDLGPPFSRRGNATWPLSSSHPRKTPLRELRHTRAIRFATRPGTSLAARSRK